MNAVEPILEESIPMDSDLGRLEVTELKRLRALELIRQHKESREIHRVIRAEFGSSLGNTHIALLREALGVGVVSPEHLTEPKLKRAIARSRPGPSVPPPPPQVDPRPNVRENLRRAIEAAARNGMPSGRWSLDASGRLQLSVTREEAL